MRKRNLIVLAVLMFFLVFCVEEMILPLNNQPSVSISVDKVVITSSDSIIVTCTARDDEKDTLRYKWSAKFGTFSSKSINDTIPEKITWYPTNLGDGSYYINVSVSDSINAPVIDSIRVRIHNNEEFPVEPTLTFPADRAQKIANNVTFQWEKVNVEGKTLLCELYLGTEENPALFKSDISGDSLKVENLEYNTTYYWFVRAKYEEGKYTDSDTLSFTTRALLTADVPSGIEFVTVTAGEFKKGEDNSVTDIPYDYEIMKYEVTNLEYVNFLNALYTAKEIYFSANDEVKTKVLGFYDGDEDINADTNFVYFNLNVSEISFANEQFSVPSDSNDYPVRGVTWFGANAFAKYYNLKLPTELEWEKAARGNSGLPYPASDTLTFDMANVMDSLDINGDSKLDTVLSLFGGPTVKGFYNGSNTISTSYRNSITQDYKSPYGAYDMAGNVMEWVANIYFNKSYNVAYRKAAGGSFLIKAEVCKSYNYFTYEPEIPVNHVGFRCVKKQ